MANIIRSFDEKLNYNPSLCGYNFKWGIEGELKKLLEEKLLEEKLLEEELLKEELLEEKLLEEELFEENLKKMLEETWKKTQMFCIETEHANEIADIIFSMNREDLSYLLTLLNYWEDFKKLFDSMEDFLHFKFPSKLKF